MLKRGRNYLFVSIFSFGGLCFAAPAYAQVVTSRFVSSDPLDNPAAAASRKEKGFFIKANRDEDHTTALELVNSSLGIETVTNVVQAALIYQSSYFFAEANVAMQNGTKTTTSTLTAQDLATENSSTMNTNSINLVPIQLATAFRLGDLGSFGLKFIQASAVSDNNSNFQFEKIEYSPYGQEFRTLTAVNELNAQNNQYTTLGAGLVLNLFGSGFWAGVAADYMQLAIDQKIDGTSRTTYENNVTETATNSVIKQKIMVVKEIYGLSYLYRSPDFAFRTEVNYQKMPPMDASLTMRIGELTRGTMEMIWGKLYGGFEVANKRGYFLDPNNLVPIYFNFAHLTDEAAFSYGFFGGFKLAAGHSFGASYFESNEQKHEQLSATDLTLYSIERKTRSFGLSYSYVF